LEREQTVGDNPNFIDGIKYYLYSLLFAKDRLYFIKRFVNRMARGSYVEKDIYVIYQHQLRTWLAIPSSRFYMYMLAYERSVVDTVRRLITPESVFIDVGAFIGFYSILAAKLRARVIALEPDPRSFQILLHNIEMSALRQRVLLINAAVGACKGSIKLKLADNPSESSASDYLNDSRVVGVVEVPMISLDEIFKSQELKRVDVIKIDVEGSGSDVVAGAKLVLSRFRPHMIFEVHRGYKSDEVTTIKTLKREYNYECRILEFRNKRNFLIHLVPKVGK
jgi:FkbM family methyltransferase